MKIRYTLAAVVMLLGYMSAATASDDTAASPEVLGPKAATDSPAVEDVETVETVETVEVVPVTVTDVPSVGGRTDTAPRQPSVVIVAGRLHPAFVHLPLGLLIALLIFEILAPTKASANRRLAVSLWGVTVCAFVPAIISGMLRATELLEMGGQLDADLHRNLMVTAFSTLCLAAGIRGGLHKKYAGAVRWTCIALIALAAALAFAGAHQGGKLVYGENFLPF